MVAAGPGGQAGDEPAREGLGQARQEAEAGAGDADRAAAALATTASASSHMNRGTAEVSMPESCWCGLSLKAHAVSGLLFDRGDAVVGGEADGKDVDADSVAAPRLSGMGVQTVGVAGGEERAVAVARRATGEGGANS